MTPTVVAIDGAAGAGKSTLARELAREFGFAYVNTGLMYRALTAAALKQGVDLDDDRALLRVTRALSFRMRDSIPPELEVEGWTEQDLTQPEVEMHVSHAARHELVRKEMRATQRALGERRGTVMEGRDIGTVVFPDAPVKIFLTADPATRGARRLEERGDHRVDVAVAVHARDAKDAHVSRPNGSAGVVVIDTTDLSAAATLERAIAIVRERLP